MNPDLQKELDILLEDFSRRESPPTLLLHVCCAPCASYVLEYLSPRMLITISYYNPNIYPEEEYLRRLDALEKLLAKMQFANSVRFAGRSALPAPPVSANKVRRDEDTAPYIAPSNCEDCFRMRLEHTAKLARERGADYFATTLSISPHKDSQLLHRIAAELAGEYGVAALPCDFKKRGGYARSVELCKQMNIYRQNYCGCRYTRVIL
jgi:hypothetical protein